jgi:hypothetical protein
MNKISTPVPKRLPAVSLDALHDCAVDLAAHLDFGGAKRPGWKVQQEARDVAPPRRKA